MSSRGLTTGSRKTIKNTNKFSILTGSRELRPGMTPKRTGFPPTRE
ncbi:MAG TPA: palindromic element RPE4 domain-containing protein [Rickettsia endosymbiont of Ceroptres masudai]|nr:palindromic element RPE4 domain-containing protein [Rickettsia endosymbiont of Ceroptres masudai]